MISLTTRADGYHPGTATGTSGGTQRCQSRLLEKNTLLSSKTDSKRDDFFYFTLPDRYRFFADAFYLEQPPFERIHVEGPVIHAKRAYKIKGYRLNGKTYRRGDVIRKFPIPTLLLSMLEYTTFSSFTMQQLASAAPPPPPTFCQSLRPPFRSLEPVHLQHKSGYMYTLFNIDFFLLISPLKVSQRIRRRWSCRFFANPPPPPPPPLPPLL